jgi:hypothetical protein
MPDKWAQYAQPAATPAAPADKWTQYAQPGGAAPPAPPAPAPAPTPKKGLLDRLADWGADTYATIPKTVAAKGGSGFEAYLPESVQHMLPPIAHEGLRVISNAGNAAVRGLTALPAGAVDKVEGLADLDNWTPAGYQKEQQQQIDQARANGTLRVINPGDKIPEPTEENAADYMSEQLGNGAAGLVTGAAAGKLLRLPSAVKDIMRGDVDAPIAGTDITPRGRYAAAKRVGVDLPPAQATNSRVLTSLDKINREGVLSAPLHEKLNKKNMGALTHATDSTLQGMSPLTPEEGGNVIQGDLRKPFVGLQNHAHDTLNELSPLEGEAGGAKLQSLAQDALDKQHEEATAGYKDVSDNYGNLPANNVGSIVQTAEDIGKKNGRFGVQFPSLESKRMMSVVGDAAQLGNESQRKYLGAPQIGDLIRSRSALLDLTRDPEIIKSSYGGDIQRLIAAHDQAIMDSLPEEGQQAWRDANAKWESMKNTFDNPSSPFYSAVRTPNPSTLTTGIGGTAPEAVRTLRKITGPEGAGIVGRGVGEKILGRTGTGEYDLGNASTRLERMPAESRDELFGNDKHETLRDIGRDAQALKPFEKAATTDNPESLVQGVGPQTAAGVRNFRDLPIKPEGAMGPAAPRVSPEGMGAVRRGVTEKMLGTTGDGTYNFPRFAGNLEKLNEGYRNELFSPEEHQRLRDIGTTSRVLDTDYNRSGSGKLLQKIFEMGKMATGVPLLQYPLAKFMTSPAASEWLMEPSWKPSPLLAPAAGAAAYEAEKKKR